ncbi:hypothetical protein GCM10010300_60650 [Streptomyces olivaceoviridis]|uniref:isochorismatase family protein n=1 Tax=Streptomyces olivaceoviridis TaxID=1921 RepID=UPI0019A98AFC|nr:isochorismatase family protein [Streptomyces olivaceoviridis]GGZ08681.1 hypothetical protein GCM10010300_60650 [Streptomyces olivaceoviridis]
MTCSERLGPTRAGFPGFKAEFERIRTLGNPRRLLAGPNDVTIGTMCVESTAHGAMERGYRVTPVPDATAPDGGPDSYEQMLRRYALVAHEVLTTDELPATRPFPSR